jgi:hypothetical protein
LEGAFVPAEVDAAGLLGVFVPAVLDDVADPVAAALLVFCRFPVDFLFLIRISFRSFCSSAVPCQSPGLIDLLCVGRVGSVFTGRFKGRCGRSGL